MQLQNVILIVPHLFQAAFASPTAQHVDERSTSSQPLCGVVGYDCGKYVLNKAQCSVAQCEALCKKNSKCKSSGYGQNTCRLYSAAVKDNVTRKSGSPYKFYDRACPCLSSVTAPRTTTSAKQATTTSSMTFPKTRTTSTKTSTTSTKTSTTSMSTTKATTTTTMTATASTATTSAATTTTKPPAAPSNKCNPVFDGGFEQVQASNVGKVGAADSYWRLSNAEFTSNENSQNPTSFGDKFVTFNLRSKPSSTTQTLNQIGGGDYRVFYAISLPQAAEGTCRFSISYAGVELNYQSLGALDTSDGSTFRGFGFTANLPAGTDDLAFTLDCTDESLIFGLDNVYMEYQNPACQRDK
ncbi:unnamed protein product [Zymoseptoria tritici ST99CH_3D1]|nr:unnamed protein product [Zymoseptoria tritici ST99CH_3D1]